MTLFSQSECLKFDEALLKKKSYLDYLGCFTQKEAEAKQMRIVTGCETSAQGDTLVLHLLVDPQDGVIADVRFQIFGKSVFYLTLAALSELILLKSYTQAGKVTSQLIENKLKKETTKALDHAFDAAINLSLFALDDALKGCMDIAVDEKELVTPLESDQEKQEVPNWLGLDLKTQLEILEGVIATEIRPYIEMDEGGIEIVSLKDGIFLTIGYKGACTTCHSSTGSTLNAIQQILRNKVFPAIVVIPDASWLNTDQRHQD